MNQKELSELKRRFRPDKSAIHRIYGCFVNGNKEIVSYLDESMGRMPEEESAQYLGFLKKALSGTLGKQLIDIVFSTQQVADSQEHKLLSALRDSQLKDAQARETFYHGLILGLCAILNNRYRITSNRESGDGRFDIQLLPLNKKLPGILMELKAGKDCTEKQLKDLAHTALTQIQEKQYHVDMTAQGIVHARHGEHVHLRGLFGDFHLHLMVVEVAELPEIAELFAGGPRLGDPFFVKRGVDAPLDQIGKVVGGFPVADIIDRHRQKR